MCKTGISPQNALVFSSVTVEEEPWFEVAVVFMPSTTHDVVWKLKAASARRCSTSFSSLAHLMVVEKSFAERDRCLMVAYATRASNALRASSQADPFAGVNLRALAPL